MKKTMMILLAALLMLTAALAENPFAPYVFTCPETVKLQENEGIHTFVSGSTRVVTQVIARVPDEDPVAALERMMMQFDEKAVIGGSVSLIEGYWGLTAVTARISETDTEYHHVMVLSADGTLLILTAYDLLNAPDAPDAMLSALLDTLTVDGAKLLITRE